MKQTLRLAVLLVCLIQTFAAPVAETGRELGDPKSDVPVKELENLKMEESSKEFYPGMQNREHMEIHRLGAVQENGELVSRLEQHASADASGAEKPTLHAQTQLDVPSEGVHKMLIQDGTHVSVLDATVHTTPAAEEQTTKIFHGAARLVQTGAASNIPTSGHTAVRRAFNADITKETKNNMTKEEAIAFLQEIKFNIDYLRAHYTQNLKTAEENAQQEKLRSFIMEQNAKEYQYRPAPLQSFPFGGSPDIIRSISGKTWDLSNNLGVIPSLPVTGDLRPEPVKRTYDPMLQTNIISTSDYDRDGQIISEEEYEEMMEKLRVADSLYTEYTLEEIIYQLAKMMFSRSLSRGGAGSWGALEAERGRLARSIEKKVLDVMMAALTDTIGDRPDLLQTRDGLGLTPANRIMHQFLETSASEPSVSRAILAAYKDELLKGPPLHKLAFSERN